jgi:hypothetical protein
VAPADVYFSPAAEQTPIKREPIIRYVAAPFPTDVTGYALAGAVVLPFVWRRLKRRGRA